MANFLAILKKIGTVGLAVEKVALPIVSIAVPGAAPVAAAIDDIVTRTQNAIVTVEANNPVLDGNLKADAVLADFEASLGLTQSILAASGQTMQYDAAAFAAARDAQVAAYNAFAALKTSFKIVPLPKIPGLPTK